MKFLSTNLGELLPLFDKLDASTKPLWGSMSAQRMVEHLTDVLKIAMGEQVFPLAIEEEKIPRMLTFLESDKPMMRNIDVPFAVKDIPLRHSEIELAIDEYAETWLDLEILFAENPSLKTVHPYYGPLNFDQWERLHSKHLTHHFIQFDLISEEG